jgi:hypothetical protein
MRDRWVHRLLTAVAGCWDWHALALEIRMEVSEPQGQDGCWEVWAYPAVQEILGGERDGETGWTGFDFDVARLLRKLEGGHARISTAAQG